jgi:hypothetical protein
MLENKVKDFQEGYKLSLEAFERQVASPEDYSPPILSGDLTWYKNLGLFTGVLAAGLRHPLEALRIVYRRRMEKF